MMTPREQYLETVLFGQPDRIPFRPGGGRKATRERWASEGMDVKKGPMQCVSETLGLEIPEPKQPQVDVGINFKMDPMFEEKVLERKDGHLIVQDWKGNICEISDEFDVTYLRNAIDFVTRRWIKCPVENRADFEEIKKRYNPDSPGRFADDFADRCKIAAGRDWPMTIGVDGPFWMLREWCGFEGLCMMMIDDPELVDDMAEFYRQFVESMFERMLEHVVPDTLFIGEDMAYKEKPMISPGMTRRWCMPSWTSWIAQVKQAGVPTVTVDSDGRIDEIIPMWIEAGANICEPIEVAAGCDIVAYRQEFGHKMAYTGGVDKRAIAKGGQVILDELDRIAPVIRDGGFIPSCDHGVPHDISWPNFLHYCKRLAELTGWL
jgi:uroporphyrinogen-III decarboxylase